jgi:hypothetical protein
MRDACKIAGRWLVIAAMMSAFGGHWLVLQSVAWTAMVCSSALHESLGEALAETFDGLHPCPLCKKIEKGSSSEKQRDAQAAMSKIDFFFQTSGVALVAPRRCREWEARDSFAEERGLRPILQPPRETPA